MTLENIETRIEDFRKRISDSESGGNYRARYKDLAFGRYQFTRQRIKDVAIALNEPIPSVDVFLTDREMQDRFFIRHLMLIAAYIIKNKLYLITKKVTGKNKYPKTVTVNVWGMIAGAHLGGVGGMHKFLIKDIDKCDALGTYISDYVAKFSDLMNV